jgi:hypothetical protein
VSVCFDCHSKNETGAGADARFFTEPCVLYSAAAGFTSAFAGAGAECLAEISTTSMQITVKMAEV